MIATASTTRIPLAIPFVGEAEAANLRACIDENFVSSVGRFVTEFEAGVAARSGSVDAVATGAGTQALHIALRALDIGRDDLVVLPTFTFIASANAISHAGAIPWLMDIGADDWALDPEALERTLESETERRGDRLVRRACGRAVRAVLPVYTLGAPADMVQIRRIAQRFGLAVIADAAAAIGAEIDGRPLSGFADLTCYSFNGNKTITCGGGGAIVGDDIELLKRARHLSTTARTSANYDHDQVGFNYRMTNLQAAVGCAQLGRLDDFLTAKARIWRRYEDGFADLVGVQTFPTPHNRHSTHWFSGIVIDVSVLPSVAALAARLAEDAIEARPFWKPVHLQAPYAATPVEPCPVAEKLWSRILTLPCSTSLTERDQDRVIASTRRALSS